MNSSPRRLPITLLAGFFGAGKTTILHHCLAEHRGGLLALILVHSTEFAFDAGVARGVIASAGRKGDQVFELRDDDAASWQQKLVSQVREAAQANRFERVIIELSGWINPGAVTDLVHGTSDLARLVEIDNVVTVLDGLRYWREIVAPSIKPRGLTPVEQGIVSIMQAQIAAASAVILHKTDLLDDDRLAKCKEFFLLGHPQCSFIEARFGQVAPETLFVPGAHLPKTDASVKAASRTPEYAVSILYRARRPFHPQRFWDTWFSEWPDIVRGKGFFWLATRMDFVGGLSQAGSAYSIGIAGQWWAAMPRENWPQSGEPRARLDANWKEPFGDRRQEIILVGKPEGVKIVMDAFEICLLTDDEMDAGLDAWSEYSDPFPEWKPEEEAKP